MYTAAVNAAIRDVPDDMTVAIHTCRGNFKSTWLASAVTPTSFAERRVHRLDVDGFFLEYDDERSGGFEPLRLVPKGKKVVLGLVSSKLPELEAKDTLKRRIDAAAKYVPMENLCLSPQCGFSSTHHGKQPHRRAGEGQAQAVASTPPAKYGAALKTHSGYLHFDLRLSRRGLRLNKMCASLCTPENGKRSSATSKAT